MNPISDQLESLFKTQTERELFFQKEGLEHENRMLKIRVEELEKIIEGQIQHMVKTNERIRLAIEELRS